MKKSFISILLTLAMVSASCMPAFGTEAMIANEASVSESATNEEASETEVVEEAGVEAESEQLVVEEELVAEEEVTTETEEEEELSSQEEESVAEEGATVEETAAEEEPVAEKDEEVTVEEEPVSEENADTANTENEAAVSEEELTVEAETEAVQKEAAAAGADTENNTDGIVIAEVEVEAESYQADVDISCDEMFAAYVDDAFGITEFSDGKLKGKSVQAGSKLTDADLLIYNSISGVLPSIASGDQTSTVFTITTSDLGYDQTGWTAAELGVDAVYSDGGLTAEAGTAAVSKFYSDIVTYDLSKIVNALIADFPYLLYWFDKTTGVSASCNISVIQNNSGYRCYVKSINFRFAVAEEYASSEKYTVDPSTGESVGAAVANASAIVSKYSGQTDFDILTSYCKEICELADYNEEAAINLNNGTNGNPWQLIWVFDGNDDTKVVCEGYAKAFKYLCDNTDFKSDNIGSITVTGGLNGTAHMWNIIHMEDGYNYLADVTNYDQGYRLFLSGGDGSPSNGYTVGGLSYAYDSGTLGLWGTDSGNELTLRDQGYEKHVSSDWETTQEPTCTKKGIQQKVCIWCGDVLETGYLDLVDHTWEDEYTVDMEPTYTTKGSKSIHCAVCDAVKEGSSQVIDVLPSGWMKDAKGWRYLTTSGTYLKNKFATIDGKVYYFNSSGYRVTGLQTIGGSKYYFNSSGVRQTGWQTIGGKKYYFKKTGPMHIGWLKYGGYYYYFRINGVMLTGWLKKSGKMYYFKTNGQRLSGWLKRGGKYFYFKVNGEMLTGWLKKSGKYYYFRTNGERLTGWLKRGGKYYYFKPSNGQMVTGRYKIGSTWFTFNSNGVRQ